MTEYSRYHDIFDLRDSMAEDMALDALAVENALHGNRDMWGRYEDISARQYATLCRVVWEQVTGTTYPDDWARQDTERLAGED